MKTPIGAAVLCLAMVASGCGGAPVEPASTLASEPADPDPQQAKAPGPSGPPDVVRQLAMSARFGCGVMADGQGFSCAIRADRKVACWGRNHSFQLGTPEPDPAVPTAVQEHLLGRAASE